MKLNLDKQIKGVLRNIYFGKEYDFLVRLADEIRYQIRTKKIDDSSQWNTIKSAIANENQAEGIRQFLNIIKEIALEQNEKIKEGKQNNS